MSKGQIERLAKKIVGNLAREGIVKNEDIEQAVGMVIYDLTPF